MITASKDIITIMGNYTDAFVQGYFEYDSKKSGGVTVSHLRFSKNKIRSTYYVENPDIVVVSKDSYFNEFEILNKISENSIMIINTTKSEEELNCENEIRKLLEYDANINIMQISTSEIRVTVLIDEKYSDRALVAVHDAFGLAE